LCKAGGTTYTDLTVEGCGTVEAYGINNNDEVVGSCSTTVTQGFFKNPATGEEVLYGPPGAVSTSLFAINLDGYMAGVFRLTGESDHHGVFTDSSTWTPVDVPGAVATTVAGLNASNAMSGYACSLGCTTAQGFTSLDGVNFALFDYPGVTQTFAFGLSDSGAVVGYFSGATGVHGFIKEGATFTQIDVPGSDATSVYGISPDGSMLVGVFHDASGFHGFLATVEAADTTPPTITATANPSQLWPPNGKMVPVTVSGSMTDSGSGVDPATASYTVLDEYGLIQPSGPITLQPNGIYRFTVAIQASRRGQDQDGRHYTIAVSAKDLAGNPGVGTAVVVPHG
jgi:hypothetical protein